jgi:hypothetical protein
MNSRRIVLVVLAVVALASIGFAQSKPAAGGAEQQVLQAEKDRFAAMIKPDGAALGRLLADDAFYTHSNALLQTKQEFIRDLTSGAYDYVSVTSEPDVKVHVYGTTAVVNGVAAVNVIDHGNDLKIKIRYTVTHVNRNGQWQMVSWQSTRFPQ